jgi:hypothetical protein
VERTPDAQRTGGWVSLRNNLKAAQRKITLPTGVELRSSSSRQVKGRRRKENNGKKSKKKIINDGKAS